MLIIPSKIIPITGEIPYSDRVSIIVKSNVLILYKLKNIVKFQRIFNNTMTKICAICNKTLVWPEIFNCYYCQKTYCDEHSQPENHQCPKVMSAKHIEQDYLRRKGVNITSGRYMAVCKQCGYQTEYTDIEEANEQRINHIKSNGCDGNSVKLREHEDDKKADKEFEKAVNPDPSRLEGEDWMYQCLSEAKSIIKRHHMDYDALKAFFDNTTYELYIQNDNESAYAYINLLGSSHFPIGIHPALSKDTPENQRNLVVVLIHELLHAIHQDWGHDKINPLEDKLANLGCYFDALINLRNLAISGKMRFCS